MVCNSAGKGASVCRWSEKVRGSRALLSVCADTTHSCRVVFGCSTNSLLALWLCNTFARVQGHDTCSISVSCGVNVAAVVVGATRV